MRYVRKSLFSAACSDAFLSSLADVVVSTAGSQLSLPFSPFPSLLHLCHPSAPSLLCSDAFLSSQPMPSSLPRARCRLCPSAPSLICLEAFVSSPADTVVSTLSFTVFIFPSLPTLPPLPMPDGTNKLLAGEIKLGILVFLVANIPTSIPSLIDSSPQSLPLILSPNLPA